MGYKNKPQMNAQSCACLRHALRTGGRIHVCPAGHTCLCIGFTPAVMRIHVWLSPYVSAYRSGRDAGEHNADERRFIRLISAARGGHLEAMRR